MQLLHDLARQIFVDCAFLDCLGIRKYNDTVQPKSKQMGMLCNFERI